MQRTAGVWRLLIGMILAVLTLARRSGSGARAATRVRGTGHRHRCADRRRRRPGGNTAAYACSKDDAWNLQFSKWFQGELSTQGQLSAKANDGTEVTGTLQGTQLSGQLGSLSWSADLVTSGTAGLFRGRNGDEVHAVIEAPDGTRVGRVWSVVNGAHVGTWDFSTAVATPIGGGLRVQRNQPGLSRSS